MMKTVCFEVQRAAHYKDSRPMSAAAYTDGAKIPERSDYSPGWRARITIDCDEAISDEDVISLLAAALIRHSPPRVEIRSR